MSHWRDVQPEHRQENEFLELPTESGPKVVFLFPGDGIAKYTGVLVEMYDKSKFGKGRRLYQAEFDESERKAIARLYTRAYGWVMRTGHPDNVQMQFRTYHLLIRAANFFATL